MLAKASEKMWGGVIDLHDVELRRRMFARWPVEEVWGIGAALAERLRPLGVRTAAELSPCHRRSRAMPGPSSSSA